MTPVTAKLANHKKKNFSKLVDYLYMYIYINFRQYKEQNQCSWQIDSSQHYLRMIQPLNLTTVTRTAIHLTIMISLKENELIDKINIFKHINKLVKLKVNRISFSYIYYLYIILVLVFTRKAAVIIRLHMNPLIT